MYYPSITWNKMDKNKMYDKLHFAYTTSVQRKLYIERHIRAFVQTS